MTDRVTKPRQRRKKETTLKQENKIAPAKLQALPDISAQKDQDCATDRKDSLMSTPRSSDPNDVGSPGKDVILRIRSQYRLPMSYQPSMADAYDNVFIAHFVALNSGIRSYQAQTPWIALLPGLQQKAQTPALKLSIRAAAMAFYARVHGDAPVLVDSYRWYTRSLENQRKALSRLSRNAVPSDEECLAPIILGLYEVYAGTTPSTVFQHLNAAASILAMKGPRNCSSEEAFPLFLIIRVSEAHKAVVFNKPSVFATPEWMTLPFLLTPKNAHMHLVDIILSIPECIRLTGTDATLSGFFSNPLPPIDDLTPVRERTKELLDQLNKWAERHPHLCTIFPASQVITTEDMTTPIDLSAPKPQAAALKLPDTFVASATAAFKAAHLVLTLLLAKVSPAGPAADSEIAVSDLTARAVADAKDILEVSTYVESTHPVGFNFLRCVFPLVIAAILSPLAEDRKAARSMLDRWGAERGLGGLCGSWVGV
ncbi:uncharacterized protein EI97DRAFT_372370 [Westerdykella ornata]|uniref:Uncharacterized protein n=1 Tax=Westerdykella ornata TaxID=318751 RepID=A0A6A6JR62_WESOR|nr:uncharacterized protein EI97DRAFT_372370 [Westerdykella ornata]KAF2279121.1 hypothetical protein EI97DRAFT_372370 [Westerdykella ornata]